MRKPKYTELLKVYIGDLEMIQLVTVYLLLVAVSGELNKQYHNCMIRELYD